MNPVIAELARTLRDKYVFADVGARLAADIEAFGDARIDVEGVQLAKALTDRLVTVSNDKHLRVAYAVDPAPGFHENSDLEAARRASAARNFGFEKVERLVGNVGYLDLRGFVRPDWGAETAAAAMTFLANSSAMVIDLRLNGGGEPAMIALITSYLFGPKPVHLNDLWWREGDRLEQFWTLPDVPGKRSPETPVFVLTSRRTFSGGEEFANNLKVLGRATIVGERTGGGAHPCDVFPLANDYVAVVPTGRAINPVTGGNWEGCGVAPDIEVPMEDALPVAQTLALQKIAESLDSTSGHVDRGFADEVRGALAARGG